MAMRSVLDSCVLSTAPPTGTLSAHNRSRADLHTIMVRPALFNMPSRAFYALCILTATLWSPLLTAAKKDQTVSSSEMLKVKQQLVWLINQERRKAGLRPVEADEFASEVAERHCQEMMQN